MSDRDHEPVYVISVAARLVDLPSWVLRVLDQEGVVVPTRTDSNRRLYSNADIKRLERVHELMTKKEVNIAGIKIILEMELEKLEKDAMQNTPTQTNNTPTPPKETT
jgi:MerR family transcriptional regulator, heat shock protein HspR